MALVSTSDLQTQDHARSSSEELRPIRVGTAARQPAPDIEAVLYIGLATLLPASRLLCSCAGLFFARVKSYRSDERVTVEVAALERYFNADDDTYHRHVRIMVLSKIAFAQLLEWDRRLAGMPTCEVRELVKDHVRQVLRAQKPSTLAKVSVATDTLQTPCVPNPEKEKHQHVEEDAHPLRDAPKSKRGSHGAESGHDAMIDVDKLDFEHRRASVIVPLEAIQELVPTGSAHHHLPGTRMNRLFFDAALRQLRREQQEARNKKQRRALRNKERRIRRVFRLRGQIPAHKFIEVTPFKRSQHGEVVAWRVDIDVPAAA